MIPRMLKKEKKSDLANNIASKPFNLRANHEKTDDKLECEYSSEEFANKKFYKEHTQTCPICEMIFKEPHTAHQITSVVTSS